MKWPWKDAYPGQLLSYADGLIPCSSRVCANRNSADKTLLSRSCRLLLPDDRPCTACPISLGLDRMRWLWRYYLIGDSSRLVWLLTLAFFPLLKRGTSQGVLHLNAVR